MARRWQGRLCSRCLVQSQRDAKAANACCVSCSKSRDLPLEPIENIPPAEAEARYYAQQNELALVTYSNQTAFGKPGAVPAIELIPTAVDLDFCATVMDEL